MGPVTIGTWYGTGYVALNPVTNNGAYVIEGGAAGGRTDVKLFGIPLNYTYILQYLFGAANLAICVATDSNGGGTALAYMMYILLYLVLTPILFIVLIVLFLVYLSALLTCVIEMRREL